MKAQMTGEKLPKITIIDRDKMDFAFEITDEIFSENQIVEKYIADWGYLRPKRGEFPTFQFTFPNPDELYFLIAVCTSPSDYVGRIVGHSGIGEYDDVIVDGGTMTINPRYTGEMSFRCKGVGRSMRDKRDLLAEKKAIEKNIPYILVVGNPEESYAKKYSGQPKLPEWVKERIVGKFHMMFDPSTN